jgi:hypothetical protein
MKTLLRIDRAMVLIGFVLALAVRAETVVTWEALKKLDVLAERCEALCEKYDVVALRQLAATVKQAALVVATDALPKGAKQPDQIKVLQGDLKSLADAITAPAQQDAAALTAILAGMHPIVEKLMEAAGLPHVHESDAPAKKEKP